MSHVETNLAKQLQAVTEQHEQAAAHEPRPLSPVDKWMDPSVKPGDDFYRFVNGKWLDTHDIPADKSSFGHFVTLREESIGHQLQLLADLQTKDISDLSADEQKMLNLHQSYSQRYQSEPTVADLGAVDQLMAKVASATTHDSIAQLMGELSYLTISMPIGFGVGAGYEDNETNQLHLGQSGLRLPGKSYYEDKEEFAEIQAKYVKLMTGVFERFGVDNPQQAALDVWAIEKCLAEQHWTPTECRDVDRRNNPCNFEQLSALCDGFDINAFFKSAHLPTDTQMNVAQPDVIAAFAKTFASFSPQQWQSYMQWSVLKEYGSLLHQDVRDLNFDFYSKTIRGVEEQRALPKRALDFVNGYMGDALGQLYIKHHVDPKTKPMMSQMIGDLLDAFEDRIGQLEWMDAETKALALKKLHKFTPYICYPDKWDEYEGLEFDPQNLVSNVIAADVFENQKELNDIGKPVDKQKWGMTPQTVNAYYSPSKNQIVFPAAIIQAPFFHPQASDARNYAGIGAVIGHEISHGFDDKGSKFDGDGKLNNWWTDFAREKFDAATGRLVEQYNGFEMLPGQSVNGQLTLGENIGDLSGASVAQHAYKLRHDKIRAEHGEEAYQAYVQSELAKGSGYTTQQQFLMSYGKIFCTKFKEGELKNRLLTDPHSPGECRANGVVRNLDSFYEAFDVKEKDALYLESKARVRLW